MAEKLKIIRVGYNFIAKEDYNESPWGYMYVVGERFNHPTKPKYVTCTQIIEDKREGVPCVKIYFDDGSMVKQYNINQIYWIPEEDETRKTDVIHEDDKGN